MSQLQLTSLDSVWNSDAVNLSFDRIKEEEDSWWDVADLKKLVAADNLLSSVDSRIGALDTLSFLDLHNNRLETLPIELSQLQCLVHLNVSSNRLGSFPDKAFPPNLVELFVGSNVLRVLPDSIGHLKNLKIIQASDNALTELPTSLSQCRQLEKLNVSQNKIMDISNISWSSFRLLNELDLSRNRLQNFGNSTIEMSRLARMDLSHNSLQNFPLGSYSDLKDLILSFNRLSGASGNLLFSTTNLEILDVRDNQLSDLPKDILVLKKLKRLDVSNNQLVRLNPNLGLLELQAVFYTGNPMKIPQNMSTDRLLIYLRDKIVVDETAKNQEIFSAIPSSNSHVNSTRLSIDLSKSNLLSLEARYFPFSPVTLLASVNHLERLPPFVYDIGRNLKVLELRQNRFKVLHLGPLPSLKCFDISGNQIEDLVFMEPLPLLDQLTASMNRLKKIPNLQHCPVISKLILNDNQISEVDSTILFKARKTLKTLDLRNNDIRLVPDALGYLDVTYLGLTGNPFKAPRQAILGQGKPLHFLFIYFYYGTRTKNVSLSGSVLFLKMDQFLGAQRILAYLRERLVQSE